MEQEDEIMLPLTRKEFIAIWSGIIGGNVACLALALYVGSRILG